MKQIQVQVSVLLIRKTTTLNFLKKVNLDSPMLTGKTIEVHILYCTYTNQDFILNLEKTKHYEVGSMTLLILNFKSVFEMDPFHKKMI